MTAGGTRLRALARRAEVERDAVLEHCEMCSEPIPPQHRHLLDMRSRELVCVCRACKLLFDRPAASDGHYRLVPDRRLRLEAFVLDHMGWAELRIPVDMAFFLRSSQAGRVVAYYPSPAGPTESLLDLSAWEQIESDNPVLGTLEPDTEALLVNRARDARHHFLVPIDDPYRLVALIRQRWRGFTGGKEAWEGIAAFFDDLTRRSKTMQQEVV